MTTVTSAAVAGRTLERERSWIAGRHRLLLYYVALLVSVANWVVAIRAPLWLDETGSYWQISGSAHDVWARRIETIAFPSYGYLLWLWAKLFGTGEVTLRLLSLFAMLAALVLFICAVRYVVDTETSIAAGVLLAVHPAISFAAIDVRPYAWAALATSAALYLLFRYRRNAQAWPMVCVGLLAAAVVSFQYLFAVLAVPLLLCLIVLHEGDRSVLRKKIVIASAAFVAGCAPMVPGILDLFQTSGTHVFEEVPPLWTLLLQIAPFWIGLTFVLLFCATRAARVPSPISPPEDGTVWAIALSLGLVPLLVFFAISRFTQIHLFTPRHCLIAAPGCALAWALVVRRLFGSRMRLLFYLLLVSLVALMHLGLKQSRQHSYTWKYALAVADGIAAGRNESLLICSDFPEADFAPMPLVKAKTSKLYAPLSYYHVAADVVPFPRSLTPAAIQEGRDFLEQAKNAHRSFVALGYLHSFDTLNWLQANSGSSYVAHYVGDFDGVRVIEFTYQPR